MKYHRLFAGLLTLCLILAATLGLSGCSLKNNADECKAAMEAMLDAVIANDVDAAKALMHPVSNVTDEQFDAYFEKLASYMPVTEDYKISYLSMKNHVNASPSGTVKTVSGIYKILSDGQTFYAVFSYKSSSSGVGFEKLRFLNEEDFALLEGIGWDT